CPNVTIAKTNPSETSASRMRSPTITSPPAISSINGIATPTAQSDQIGKKVSAKGRKYFRACSRGPNWKVFQNPAMKNISPKTSRANNSAQPRSMRLGFTFSPAMTVVDFVSVESYQDLEH